MSGVRCSVSGVWCLGVAGCGVTVAWCRWARPARARRDGGVRRSVLSSIQPTGAQSGSDGVRRCRTSAGMHEVLFHVERDRENCGVRRGRGDVPARGARHQPRAPAAGVAWVGEGPSSDPRAGGCVEPEVASPTRSRAGGRGTSCGWWSMAPGTCRGGEWQRLPTLDRAGTSRPGSTQAGSEPAPVIRARIRPSDRRADRPPVSRAVCGGTPALVFGIDPRPDGAPAGTATPRWGSRAVPCPYGRDTRAAGSRDMSRGLRRGGRLLCGGTASCWWGTSVRVRYAGRRTARDGVPRAVSRGTTRGIWCAVGAAAAPDLRSGAPSIDDRTDTGRRFAWTSRAPGSRVLATGDQRPGTDARRADSGADEAVAIVWRRSPPFHVERPAGDSPRPVSVGCRLVGFGARAPPRGCARCRKASRGGGRSGCFT